jgi:hypothetical protein
VIVSVAVEPLPPDSMGFTAPPDPPFEPVVPRTAISPPPPHAAKKETKAQISNTAASRREDTGVYSGTVNYQSYVGGDRLIIGFS